MQPKIITMMPWRGINQEIKEGKKTKLCLYEDRLDYKIKYTQNIKLEFIKEGDEPEFKDVKDANNYIEEDGFVMKESITGIVKYIETQYDMDGLPYIVHIVDVYTNNDCITFTVESQEDKNKVYNELYNWKLNIKE